MTQIRHARYHTNGATVVAAAILQFGPQRDDAIAKWKGYGMWLSSQQVYRVNGTVRVY